MAEPQLAPEWLSSKLPSSSQDKGVLRAYDRDNKLRRGYGRTHSYNHLPLNLNVSSYSYSVSNSPSENSTSWRSAEPNPRVLNRSKSSPVFESKDDKVPTDTPKSPDRSNDRNLNFSLRALKQKKGKPPLLASRSQPNLLAPSLIIQQKLRSSTFSPNNLPVSSSGLSSSSPLSSTSSSLSSSSLPSSTSPPNVSPSFATIQTAQQPAASTNSMTPATSAAQEEMNKELEKFRGLVPSVPAINTKGLPRRGLETPTSGRKGSQSKLLISKKAPAAIHYFRKASSEPLLQQLPFIPRGGDAQNNQTEVKKLDPVFLHKLKAIKSDKMRLKETLEDSDKALMNRNNFFLKVIHQEKTIRDVTSSNAERVSSQDIISKEDRSVEDQIDEAEEKFLRLLGWVPDDEYHVPCLEEEEIAEARERLAVAQQR